MHSYFWHSSVNKNAFISSLKAAILKKDFSRAAHLELKCIVGPFWVLYSVVLGRPGRTQIYQRQLTQRQPGSSVVRGRLQSSRFSFHIVFSVVQGRLILLKRPETTI